MRANLSTSSASKEVHSLDGIKTRMVKASPSESAPVHDSPSLWTEALRDGLMDACESLKAAALTMEMDPSQLSRDLASGAFQLKRLEKLNAEQKTIVVRRLSAVFLEMMDPKHLALRALDEAEDKLRIARQFIAEVA